MGCIYQNPKNPYLKTDFKIPVIISRETIDMILGKDFPKALAGKV